MSFILSASLSIALSLCHAYSYSAITPGCWFNLYSTYSSKMTLGHSIVSYGLVWTLRILSSLASIILITATCCKARQLQRKITPVVTADIEIMRNNQRRRHRAKLSYSLTMAATIVVNVTILAEEVIGRVFVAFDVPKAIVIPVGFWYTILVQTYIFGDLIIILTDKQQREAFMKVIKRIFKKQPTI